MTIPLQQQKKQPLKTDNTLENFENVFDLRILDATMMSRMVSPVLPTQLLCFEKLKIFQISHEIPYFGRGHKMYETASEKKPE